MQADPFYEEVAAEAMAREAIRNVAAAEAGEMCGICSPEGAAAGARELELASVARVMAANEAAARAAEEAAGAEWQEEEGEGELPPGWEPVFSEVLRRSILAVRATARSGFYAGRRGSRRIQVCLDIFKFALKMSRKT